MMTIGIVAYKLGFGPPAPLSQHAARSSQSDQSGVVSEELVPTAQPLKSAPLSSASPALSSPAGSEQLRVGVAQPQQPDEPAKLTASAADAAVVGTDERALKLKQMGDEQLTQGLIAPARLLYERAADLGLAPAALALAATYDEAALAHSNLRGVGPDPKAAAHWYERAGPQQPDEPAKLTASAADAAVAGTNAPAIVRDDRERALKLKQMGDQQLTQGLIVPARLLYEKAADLGLAPAALALAATYDEAALAHSNLRGVGSDPKAAAHWYERAGLPPCSTTATSSLRSVPTPRC
jgi:TPR repeat protein